jgi:hypothetical protein
MNSKNKVSREKNNRDSWSQFTIMIAYVIKSVGHPDAYS